MQAVLKAPLLYEHENFYHAVLLQAFVIVHDSQHQRGDCIHFVKTQRVSWDGGVERERFCISTEMNRGILSGGRGRGRGILS